MYSDDGFQSYVGVRAQKYALVTRVRESFEKLHVPDLLIRSELNYPVPVRPALAAVSEQEPNFSGLDSSVYSSVRSYRYWPERATGWKD
jgi:hypothetical protein